MVGDYSFHDDAFDDDGGDDDEGQDGDGGGDSHDDDTLAACHAVHRCLPFSICFH